MGTTISIRVWWTDPGSGVERLGRLMEAVDRAGVRAGGWNDLTVRDASHRVVPGGVAVTGPTDLAAPPGVRIATGCAMPCWRFSPGPTEGSVPVTVVAWDQRWLDAVRFDRHLEGDAQLLIDPVGPFCAVLQDPADLVNRRVEDNLEKLLELIKALASGGGLDRVAVMSDAGDPVPVNWNLAWYRTADLAAADARWVATLAREGLPAYKIPPLGSPDAAKSTVVLHEWRPTDQRHTLADRLAVVGTEADGASVLAALKTGRFDFMEDPGLTILEYPYVFNAFLDRFFLEVLDGSVLDLRSAD